MADREMTPRDVSEPHEAVVGRRGRWAWDEPWSDEFHAASASSAYERGVLLRLTLTMVGVWGLWAVVGGSAFLLFRWLRIACWLTGCSP